MNNNDEKKSVKPVSIKFKPSTIEAINRVCHNEDRPLSYVVERAVRKDLNLEK